jgi:hypothetical protein
MGKPSDTDATLAVHTTEPDGQLTLQVGSAVSLQASAPETSDGTLALPAEAFLRLLSGRLGADDTQAGVSVTGPIDLAQLRTVFPGF